MAWAGVNKILKKKIKKLKVGDGMSVKEVNGPKKSTALPLQFWP